MQFVDLSLLDKNDSQVNIQMNESDLSTFPPLQIKPSNKNTSVLQKIKDVQSQQGQQIPRDRQEVTQKKKTTTVVANDNRTNLSVQQEKSFIFGFETPKTCFEQDRFKKYIFKDNYEVEDEELFKKKKEILDKQIQRVLSEFQNGGQLQKVEGNRERKSNKERSQRDRSQSVHQQKEIKLIKDEIKEDHKEDVLIHISQYKSKKDGQQ